VIEDVRQPLDVSRLGGESTGFEGSLALSQFPRLRAELADVQGSVQIRLQFEREASGQRTLSGALQTDLGLTCQRCLRPMRLPVETEFRLALLDAGDDPDRVSEHVEVVMLNSTQVNVLELLEDELLLCLPIAPRHHDADECRAPQRRAGSTFGESEIGERQTPFAVLRDLHVKQPPEKL
jgi:uncharacterized protein